MERAYICHPFRGDVERNIKAASEYAKEVYRRGYFPMCPHVYLEAVTGLDEKKGDREELLKLGLEMLSTCNRIFICGDIISEGMFKEIQEAIKWRIRIEDLK